MKHNSPVINKKPKIFHFHFYKNAGSSIDALLKLNFPNQWEEKEFQRSSHPSEAVLKWITDSPEIICFASHTAELGVLNSKEINLIPIVFMRHPIDRIASIYRYERVQTPKSWENDLARSSSMKGYIEERLKIQNDWQCRDYHCARLVELFKNADDIEVSDLKLVNKAVDRIPFIGLVERFQDSLNVLKAMLEQAGYSIFNFDETRENSNSAPENLDVRLAKIKEEVGQDFYEMLLEVNRDDLVLYETVARKLDQVTHRSPARPSSTPNALSSRT